MFGKDKGGFPEKEERVLEFWEKEDIFRKSITIREKGAHFSFYDGPPFATGLPHYGHILAGTIKDVVARYKTMKGFCVPRRFGWDCHGLPVENEIEKAHNLSGAKAVEQYGIANFNEECRKIVLRYTEEWKKTVLRMGRWVEFDRTYKTMDISFMESVWWVFGELWKKGLIYEGYKVMHYSPKLGTPLSNFEANLNYRSVDDPSLTVKFQLTSQDAFLLVWTTTPWTLPSNLGIGVGAGLDYVKIRDIEKGENYIIVKERLSQYYKEGRYEILETFKGEKLIEERYEPLLPYFKDHKNSFRVLSCDFISLEDGTGLVHLAPAFGEDDFNVCKKAGIDPVCPLDVNCNFTKEVLDFEGLFVKDADKDIIRKLKNEGKVFLHATIHHRYPFCWRTDKPLIYRTVSTWFVAVEKIKEGVIKNNQLIHWVPHHIKDGRFGKWLENARDWAISRNRYWGTPLPIWRADDGELLVVSSVRELEELSGEKVADLHRHFIDDLEIKAKDKVYHRVSEVFDCWFESGSMPYAQNHFPFENQEETMDNFPADFIAEGLDQTRGWFYTLMVLATALYDKPAFKNVIVNGIVLAEDGQKMSKRLKNYPDPEVVINKYGSDAIRLCLLHSPVVRAEDMNFSEKAVDGVLKQLLIPLWNSYVFLATYAEIYKWTPASVNALPHTDIDRWILSLQQKLIEDVEKGMDQYELDTAVEPFIEFIDHLTNWYIRRSRARFWREDNLEDQKQAFETLYTVLLTLVKISAPYIPFLSESIYQELRRDEDQASVHLCDFPKADIRLRDVQLEHEMKYTRLVVGAGHSLRKEHQIKVRQPLKLGHIVSPNKEVLESLKDQADLIKEELNVKELSFHWDESQFVKYRPKPNYRALGKKVGKLMDKVKAQIEGLEHAQLHKIFKKQPVEIAVEGEIFSLTEEDVVIEKQVHEGLIAACIDDVTIALDTHITPALENEGIARELVNKINLMRKTGNLEVTDRINVIMETTPKVEVALSLHEAFIKGEILAREIQFEKCPRGTEVDINGNPTIIYITKI